MKPRYSKRVREEAALICAIAASGGVYTEHGNRRTRVYAEVFRALGTPVAGALSLAVNAYALLSDVYPTWTEITDAEAEALIRTGWSPP